VWIITAWQYLSPNVTVKGFKKCYPIEWIGMLEMSVKKMATTVKMETVTLTGKGRWNLICYMYKCMKLISVVLDLDKYIFPWQTCFI
jgi:hypothetical protein